MKDIDFWLPPLYEEMYEEMYEELLYHRVEAGTLDVLKDAEALFRWATKQKHMLNDHFQGRPVGKL